MAKHTGPFKPQNFKSNFKPNKKPKPRSDENHVNGSSVEVRFDDVNGAIRRLRKVLERADRQKELAKREYYEKPSAKRKRKLDQAIKRTKRQENEMISAGEWMPTPKVGLKHLKGKREKRKAWMEKEKLRRLHKRGR